MAKPTDLKYLMTDQYRDASNLDARVQIHLRFSTNPYGWFRWVFDALRILPQDAVILEVGCGHGLLWKENSGRIPAGWHITLSDLSSGMLDAAWRNLVVVPRPFHFEEMDAESIPYGDGAFDAIVANHMLYHVPERALAIAEFSRVLKPGGRLFATTVGDHHLEQAHGWLQRVSMSHSFRSFTAPFTLENGLEQLRPFFSEVTVSRYYDELCVTETPPLVDYIRSMVSAQELSEAELSSVRQELENELREKGSIIIRKDTGLFEARK